MKSSMHTSELLSALADGQLVGEDFAAALQACQQDASALACWERYHLIGDVLRQPARAPVSQRIGVDSA
ncbi:MAG: sigma-E factor negative regulatory protein, partial [Polaromonas sp.]|nr:sigma-E factor negative regulatory protein [Polaromonas sp.]